MPRLQEAGVMARMRHPNIVAFIGVCAVPPCVLTGKLSGEKVFRNWPGIQLHSRFELPWLHLVSHHGGTSSWAATPRPTGRVAMANPLGAEYCSRGSVYALLRDPQAAPQLTWRLRLSMVGASKPAHIRPALPANDKDALCRFASPLAPRAGCACSHGRSPPRFRLWMPHAAWPTCMPTIHQ